MQLDSNQIQEVLPHRYLFLLVDRIVDGEPGAWAKGIRCVTTNEPFFCGHFPQEYAMPGVLIVEALAQVGAVAILSVEENRGKITFFGGIKNACSKQQVVPGDVLEFTYELIRQRGSVGFGTATAAVDGKVAAPAELTFAISS